MRGELVGRLRVGAILVTLPVVPLLVSPFALSHPGVAVTVISQPSVEIQRGLNDGTLDAGVTYIDNEPLDHVRTVPLYRESYYLYTNRSTPTGTARSAPGRLPAHRSVVDRPAPGARAGERPVGRVRGRRLVPPAGSPGSSLAYDAPPRDDSARLGH